MLDYKFGVIGHHEAEKPVQPQSGILPSAGRLRNDQKDVMSKQKKRFEEVKGQSRDLRCMQLTRVKAFKGIVWNMLDMRGESKS